MEDHADEFAAPFRDLGIPLTDILYGAESVLLPAYRDEGKSHLSIAFGCTGGQHRSVTLAETLAKALAEQGLQVSIRHRELQG